MNCQSFETKCGYICVCEEDGYVVEIKFNKRCDGKIERNIATQFEEYLQGKRQNFDFPVKFSGTEFQKSIWTSLRDIPYGQAVTYKQLSEKFRTSPRAIGQALKKNPLPIYFPCHRVVAKNSIGGFTGGIEWKKMLLEIEGCKF
ncbi:methylated-DNA--[protein]-cysteine S-methyltransferase [Thermotoga profunda]|uniref:methylated-DNA--[protein]-cysteine S-methyltransferase n=1 Tax=Thermotoga profunda TaxID=1508420 RepID=UPI000597508B|nr:methylated-DNA--[protein]-cysteine S-methyltransferase [Thermotoga profunda]